jgi:uncharacterized membrane protein YedE/YeeE
MIFEEFFAAHNAVLIVIFITALVMGMVANKTNFCTMGAVSDLVNMNDSGRMRAWLLAATVALIGVTLLEAASLMSVDDTLPPYRGSSFAWLEYILGGLMFGVGMTLGSGCGNKTLIRIGGGNLKSIFVFALIATCAYFMVNPIPGTSDTIYSLLFYSWTNPTTVTLTTQQDIGAILAGASGSETSALRTLLGLFFAAILLFLIYKSQDFRRSKDNNLSGIVIGLAVIMAWYATSNLVTIDADGENMSWASYASTSNWDMMEDGPETRPRDIAVQSYTFINPIGQTLRYGINGFEQTLLTFGVVAVIGVILGSLTWSLVSRSFRIEWFADVKDFINHLIGGILMGVGGILALGCTIGQAITGFSTLSIGSILAFAGIVAGSAMTMKIQYYKMMYENEATFVKAFITALVDFNLLPKNMRKLED